MKAVTCKTLQEIDRLTSERFSLTGSVLMEVAGYESYLFLKLRIEKLVKEEKPIPAIIFFVGSGNNGGDGLVMARHLFNSIYHRYPNRIVVITDIDKKSRSDLNRQQLAIIRHLKIPVVNYRKFEKTQSLQRLLKRYQGLGKLILVDALLGIGAVLTSARGSIGVMISVIDKISRAKHCSVISLDIPSGVFYGLTDSKKNSVVTADITLTYGLHKDILYYPQVRSLVGQVHLLNPGFPPSLLDTAETQFMVVDHEWVSKMIAPYQKTDYKKTRGRLAVVAGKRGMLGAAFLTTQSAWKSGVGLVTLFAPPSDRAFLTRSLPHTMVYYQTEFSKYRNRSFFNDFDAVVFGPGLGREVDHSSLLKEILKEIIEQGIPVVIDADGLYHYKTILEECRTAFTSKKKSIENAPVILTPHLGEMSHLLSGIAAPNPGVNPWEAVGSFLKHYRLRKTVVVLKSHLNYIIPCDNIPSRIVEGCNPLIGVGGSGDVLAGVIGGLTARKLREGENKGSKRGNNKGQGVIDSLIQGATAGSYVHQEAGRLAGDKLQIFTSKELLKFIPKALSPFFKI